MFNLVLQLFLLKQVGQEISVGPLGPSSIHLISYFEVRCHKHSQTWHTNQLHDETLKLANDVYFFNEENFWSQQN